MVQYHIGNKIKERRSELKLSQEQLALQAGVTTTYLGQTERAERNPTVCLLEKLANALKVDIGYFFDYESLPAVSPAESRVLYLLSELSDGQKDSVARIVEMVVEAIKSGK